MLIQSEVSFL